MPVYSSDQFSYDFDAALAAATVGRRATGGTQHPENCGPCGACREAMADYATISAYAEQRSAEPQEVRDERAFWKRFAAGDGFRPITYGLGSSTETVPAGKVCAPGTPTRERLAKHAGKFAQGTTAQKRAHRDEVDHVASLHELTRGSHVREMYTDGYTVAEIAKLTGRSRRTVEEMVAA